MLTRLSRGLAYAGVLVWLAGSPVFAADVVPDAVKMPGTQPHDGIIPLDGVTVCANCHGNYDKTAEPLHNWRGSMMAHAGRDPVFWAALAIAEQDFDGSGDLCLRCHAPSGWTAGRSAPTDGSALDPIADRDGVQCDSCHRLTNPDQSEHLGVQLDPFVAVTGDPAEGHYGSGQYVLTDSNATKLGPYADANSPPGTHRAQQSQFHRSPDLCGTCHDVSNPVTGDLAHNNGAQQDLHYNGGLSSDLPEKVAFKNRPYQYGVVERTYSEHKASRLGSTLVSDYSKLPADLQAGAIQRAFEAAIAATPDGNYADGTPRNFTCQTCHLPPVQGKGAGRPAAGRFAPPVRSDLPQHDLTGGNYWMPSAMQWLSDRGRLKFGNLTALEKTAMNDGALRARSNLEAAASISVNGNTVKLVNLTGHKLISGYPEGRRMWLNIQWFDAQGSLLREDGAYGDLQLQMDLNGDGANDKVRTLLDLHDPNTHIYEVHGAITQEWASTLMSVNPDLYGTLAVAFDRVTGEPTTTVGAIADPSSGVPYAQSMHFVLNNYVSSDTRIPPYGFSYDEAKLRNALPVPAEQYGNPGPGGEYNYWDELTLNPPAGAATATVRLLYQPTSWEYVQFLYLANRTQNPQLASTGRDYLDAWLNTGMAEPHVMATATWVSASVPPVEPPLLVVNQAPTASFTVACTNLSCTFNGSGSSDRDGVITTYTWQFGDGTSAQGVQVTHAYASAGTYQVTLTVTDDGGLTDSLAKSVTVSAPAPAPRPGPGPRR